MGIPSLTLSLEESSYEADFAFFDFLAADFFLEARGEMYFLFFFYFWVEARSFFSCTSC